MEQTLEARTAPSLEYRPGIKTGLVLVVRLENSMGNPMGIRMGITAGIMMT
jgi:hypothetical protein